MARVMGVDLPREKRVDIGLTHIFGIGHTTARRIVEKAGIDPAVRVKDLTQEQVSALSTVIQQDCKVEGELRREITADIKRLVDIGTYRGLRHRRGLPVRGQRTRTNARSRKGPKKVAVGGKRKAVGKKG